MATHPIVHVEIPSNDPKAAGKFYAGLFDWKLELDETFNYLQFQPSSDPGGAFVQVDDNVKPGEVCVYIGTDDIDATLAKINALGGKTCMPKMEIPNMGWIAIFSDPTGNKLGLFASMHPNS